MLDQISKPEKNPPIILFYSVPKFGKSTAGSMTDSPIFIRTEDGLSNIDAPAFPVAKTLQDVMGAIKSLATEDHKYKTLVIDSLDWLEPLIHAEVCRENGVRQIDHIGYGKGFAFALDHWRTYVAAIRYLRDKKKMTIFQIGHSEIKRFENPETLGYDRYQLKLHKGAAELVMEAADIIMFGNYFIGVTKDKQGFTERVRAVGSGERVLFTEERPAFKAGNRFGLPEQIPFTKDGEYWNVIKAHIPFFKKENENG